MTMRFAPKPVTPEPAPTARKLPPDAVSHSETAFFGRGREKGNGEPFSGELTADGRRWTPMSSSAFLALSDLRSFAFICGFKFMAGGTDEAPNRIASASHTTVRILRDMRSARRWL